MDGNPPEIEVLELDDGDNGASSNFSSSNGEVKTETPQRAELGLGFESEDASEGSSGSIKIVKKDKGLKGKITRLGKKKSESETLAGEATNSPKPKTPKSSRHSQPPSTTFSLLPPPRYAVPPSQNSRNSRPASPPPSSPTMSPTMSPSMSPLRSPSMSPKSPSMSPSMSPRMSPSGSPSGSPPNSPLVSPPNSPLSSPSNSPLMSASSSPTASPSTSPAHSPPLPYLPPPSISPISSSSSDSDIPRSVSPSPYKESHCANSDQLMRTIKNPQSRMAFLRFLEKTMSEELLLCWEAMENFRLTWEYSPHSLRMEKATKILDEFILDGCPRQVNVVYSLRRQIVREWDAGRFDKEIFLACEDKIFGLLTSDSFMRFTQNKLPPQVQPISAEIFDSVQKGKAVVVYQAMGDGHLNVPSIDYCANDAGLHLLHVAVSQQMLVLTEDLLQFGSNVNVRSNTEETPLHLAVKKKFYNMVTLLLKYKADPNAQNLSGKSPLHIAAMKGSKTLVKMLLASKADTTLLDNERQSPIDVAQNKKIEALMKGN